MMVVISCKKEVIIYEGADFTEIRFMVRDTVLKPNQEDTLGTFIIDGYGLPLKQIELEIEFETWEHNIQEYISEINFEKITPENKITLTDSVYIEGFCSYTWEPEETEEIIEYLDAYVLIIKTRDEFFSEKIATIQIGFYIENLFDDIEIIHDGDISGFPKKVYFEY